jgi:4-hydroxy-tetrahydrodipicolinate synthase
LNVSMSEFQGVSAAAITPRAKDGEIDLGAVLELIDHLCKAGMRGIVLFGAAGEYPSFTSDERSRVLYLAVKRTRAPILAGVGSATFDASVSLAREARDAGASGLLLPPPFFFRYGQDEIREFYLQFAAEAGKGARTFIANDPESSSPIAPETARDLLETGLFAGLSDSGRLPDTYVGLRDRLPFHLLRECDETFVADRRARASVISRAACAVPELAVALDAALCAKRNDWEALNNCLQEFAAWASRFPQPVIARVATGLRGLKVGPLPVPLSPRKQRELDEFREWFRAWLPGVKRLCAGA